MENNTGVEASPLHPTSIKHSTSCVRRGMDINYQPQRDNNTKNISKKNSSQNLLEPRSHLKITRARSVTTSSSGMAQKYYTLPRKRYSPWLSGAQDLCTLFRIVEKSALYPFYNDPLL